jgi:Zn-dependent protease
MASNAQAPQEQPFVLSFRIGSVPVAIEPSFWIISLLMGSSGGAAWMAFAWMAVVFVSILIHELGHAAAALTFGSPARIRLYSFGGLTFHQALPRLQSILVSLAGPFAGFVLGAAVILASRHWPTDDEKLQWVIAQTEWVSIGWGIMNLLPILPLDGGHVLRGVLGETRLRLTLMISVATGVLVALLGLQRHQTYIAFLFGYMAFNAARALMVTPVPEEPVVRERRPVVKPEDHAGLLESGWSQLFSGKDDDAERIARNILIESSDTALRNRALDLLTWVMLARADAIGALRQLDRVQPPDQVRALTQAMTLEMAGHLDAALAPALKAHEKEPSEATAQLVLRLLTHAQRYAEAVQAGEAFRWTRPGLKEAALSDVYAAQGDDRQAASLAQQAFESRRRPSDAIQAARYLARTGDASAALGWIERALGAGFDDPSSLASDPDFAAVRALPGFSALTARPAAV